MIVLFFDSQIHFERCSSHRRLHTIQALKFQSLKTAIMAVYLSIGILSYEDDWDVKDRSAARDVTPPPPNQLFRSDFQSQFNPWILAHFQPATIGYATYDLTE